jgi:hypothetical protein
MQEEVFLEPVPDEDISIARCSICREEFHSSPLGPRKHMSEFREHIEAQHPKAVFKPQRTRFFWNR